MRSIRLGGVPFLQRALDVGQHCALVQILVDAQRTSPHADAHAPASLNQQQQLVRFLIACRHILIVHALQ